MIIGKVDPALQKINFSQVIRKILEDKASNLVNIELTTRIGTNHSPPISTANVVESVSNCIARVHYLERAKKREA